MRASEDARLPRSFRWLLAAESASSVGTYVTLLALQTIVVVTLGGDSADTGLLSAARWLPYLVVGLLVVIGLAAIVGAVAVSAPSRTVDARRQRDLERHLRDVANQVSRYCRSGQPRGAAA